MRREYLWLVVMLGASLAVGAPRVLSGPQEPMRRIILDNFINAPVEIERVSLKGRQINNGDSIAVSESWVRDFEVTVRSVSDRPIKSIEIALWAGSDKSEETTFNAFLSYKAGTSPLACDATAVLTHSFSAGNAIDSLPVHVQVNKVTFDGDDTRIWQGGFYLRKNERGEWEKERRPTARYVFPKWFKPTPQYLKAVATPDNITAYCNVDAIFGRPNCNASGCSGCIYDEWAPTIFPDCSHHGDPFLCDQLLRSITERCYDSYCCSGKTHSSKQSLPCAPAGSEPMIVDLLGDGVQLTDRRSGVRFDYRALGGHNQIAWTTPGSDDGFLVLDRNGNGQIDNGLEWFGDITEQPRSWAPNGFRALSVLDSNSDGIIDGNDPKFSALQVWNDFNHDGLSEKNELHTLGEVFVQSISYKYELSNRVDRFGNAFRYKARMKGIKGERFAYDVFLVTR